MKKKILFSLFIVLSFICLTGCGKSSNSNIQITTDENIVTNAYMSYDDEDLIVILNNKNKYNIGVVRINAVYYDESGNKLDEDTTSCLDLRNNSECVAHLGIISDSVPKKIEVTTKIEQTTIDQDDKNNEYCSDQIDTSYVVDGDKVNISLKNNSDKELEISGAIVYYKGTTPIAQEEFRNKLGANESNIDTVDIPEDYTKEESSLLKYDSIKIFVNNAKEW